MIGITVALALAVVTAVGAATPAGADPLDDAKAKVVASQQAADAAAIEYEAAIERYEEVTAQIATLQAKIAANKEEAARLQVIAERRAVEAYTGHGSMTEDPVLTTEDPLDVLRREKLLARTKRREDNAIHRLAKVNQELDDQRAALEEHQAEQARALEIAETKQAQVQAQLTEAQAALNALEEYLRQVEEAQRARDIAASVARSASNRAGSGSGGGVAVGGIVCPIRGAVSFIDSWGHARHQGRHVGVDLMAARGTANVAVVSGSVTFRAGGTSGNGAYLSGDDGNLYYYFHLDSYEGAPRQVAQGDVIGYVGNTGDARYTATHTHFEIHPGHGPAVNPYPSVRAVC